jgi:hypothetical protein
MESHASEEKKDEKDVKQHNVQVLHQSNSSAAGHKNFWLWHAKKDFFFSISMLAAVTSAALSFLQPRASAGVSIASSLITNIFYFQKNKKNRLEAKNHFERNEQKREKIASDSPESRKAVESIIHPHEDSTFGSNSSALNLYNTALIMSIAGLGMRGTC